MPLKEILRQVDDKFHELKRLMPLSREYEKRLWEKFRLEWNYNSNHIEGNTLTYGETYLLLIKGNVTGDHSAQEIDEMRAHDLVVLKLREYASDPSRELVEADIREWNKIILVRSYWKEAITETGQPTQKLIEPGAYKKTPNSVRQANGEMFYYASPEETPIKMQELMDWYRAERAEQKLHPVELAALLHYRFVRIHPFDDSNGRTARLLMNYELLRNNYPPVIVKSSDKKNYLLALSKADAGDLKSFVDYVVEQLLWSLNVAIKAASGDSVEESGDVYKQIEVWKKQERGNEINVYLPDQEVILDLYNRSIRSLILDFVEKHNVFKDVRDIVTIISIGFNRSQIKVSNINRIESIISRITKQKTTKTLIIKITIRLNELKSKPRSPSPVTVQLEISFKANSYDVSVNKRLKGSWKYSHQLQSLDIANIVEESIKTTFAQIKQ